jgi:DNA-binding transcriptional MocR family regulator
MTVSQLPLAVRAHDLVGSVIDSSTSLLARQTHDIVRFAMGAPSDDLMPVDLLDRYASHRLPGKYSYGASEGEPGLVEQVLALQAEHGVLSSPDRITITTGGMQGLDLACKLFVDPGDLVLVEGPTYTNGNATALSYGAQLLEAPLDDDGLVVEALPDLVARAGRPPKAIYTIPTFQNPSGVTQTLRRRELLLELAARWGSMIIDDDPYGLLRFDGTHVPTFREIDPCHLDRVLGLYRERKSAMRAAVDHCFGDAARTTDPEGGFFLWVTFADDRVDTSALFETALAEGVAYIPGAAFSVEGSFRNALRLCFATSTPQRIDEGVARLQRAVDAVGRTR